MFVDASALVAIIAPEADATTLEAKLRAAQGCFTSPLAIYELALALARLRKVGIASAQASIHSLLQVAAAQIVPITPEIGRLAIETFGRYGRGHHPARLNMGDCFAYACARHLAVPLLCKGDDFAQTDIALA